MIPQFSNQPNAYTELARQSMYLLIGFQIVHWTPEQQALVLSTVSALLAVIVWKTVMPVQTIEQAGHTVMQIKTDARVNVAQVARMEEEAKKD